MESGNSEGIPLGAPDTDLIDSGHPDREPRERWSWRRWTAAAAVVALLLGLGAGTAWALYRNRADVQLAGVLEATKAEMPTAITLSFSADDDSLHALSADTETIAPILLTGSIRYAWDAAGVQRLTYRIAGKPALDQLTRGDSTTYVAYWDVLGTTSWGRSARQTIEEGVGDEPGAARQAAEDLLAGRPVTLKQETGADLWLGGSTSKLLEPLSKLGEDVASAIRDNASVSKGESDVYGQRYDVTVGLNPMWEQLRPKIKAAVGDLDLPIPTDSFDPPPLPVDWKDATAALSMWETDGRVSRVQIELADLLARAMREKQGALPTHFALVAVPDQDGVGELPPTGRVVSLRDLFEFDNTVG